MFEQNGESAHNYDLCEGERAIAGVLGRRRAMEIAGALMNQIPPSRQGSGEAGSRTRGRMACVYIPMSLSRGAAKRLIDAAGREDAEKLIRVFRGETLWFSTARGLMLRNRNNLIRTQRAQGVPIRVLAVSFDLTERAIRRICDGVQAPSSRGLNQQSCMAS